MSSGILATVDIKAGVDTLLYKMPSGMARRVTVNICNKNTSDVLIRLIAEGISLENDTIIRSNGMLERTEIALGGEQSLRCYADSANVHFMVWE